MEIIRGLENIREKRDSVITLGTFDGLHAGHKKIIDKVVVEAKNKNIRSVLVTFEPHPRLVLDNSNRSIQLLSTIDEKIDILRSFKLDVVVIVNFSKEFSNRSYQDFVSNILLKRLGLSRMIVGYDHHFGKNRKGNFDSLRELADQYNFTVEKVNPLYVDNAVVSSSLIRDCLLQGEVEQASDYLQRLYSIAGIVVKGDGRGKALKFPTANIRIDSDHKIVPANGVYAVDVQLHGNRYKGMMNIGVRPTFEDNKQTLEVHVFGLNKDIYDEQLTVFFKKRLRGELKFSSQEELVKQLEIDKERSLQI